MKSYFGRVRPVPRLCVLYPGICLTTEEGWKNLSQGSRKVPVGQDSMCQHCLRELWSVGFSPTACQSCPAELLVDKISAGSFPVCRLENTRACFPAGSSDIFHPGYKPALGPWVIACFPAGSSDVFHPGYKPVLGPWVIAWATLVRGLCQRFRGSV